MMNPLSNQLPSPKTSRSATKPAAWLATSSSIVRRLQRVLPSILPAIMSVVLASLAVTGCEQKRKAAPPAPLPKPAAKAKAPTTAVAYQVDFEEVTEASGVKSVYRNGEETNQYSIAESLGGGVGVLDYDRDGRLDLFFPGGGVIEPQSPLRGQPATLWRGGEGAVYQDVSKAAGIDDTRLYSHGVAIADIDNDGFPDILVTGYGGLQLFHNRGDGTFVERAAEAGLNPNTWSSSAAWGDFDNDGLVDLYLTTYVDWSWDKNPKCSGPPPSNQDVCTPQQFDGLDDLLYWNRGDGTFELADASAGLVPAGKGLGVVTLDVNQDSLLDIYVANDTTNNFLYINQGGRKFKETGFVSGTAMDHMGIPNGSMGLAIFDLDSDNKPEIFVTNYERETFAVYRNEGLGTFRCISERTGITALGTLLVGFGTTSGDFNCNGREDLIVANGHVMRHPRNDNLRQDPLYIANVGNGRLQKLSFDPPSYFAKKHTGRGVVAADLNNDGLLDLVFSHTNEPAGILINRSPTEGVGVGLKLIGTRSNRDAIGASVILKTTAGEQLRQVIGGGSYLSQGTYQLHWGVPKGVRPIAFEITWPGGAKQTIEGVEPGKVVTVIEPNKPAQGAT